MLCRAIAARLNRIPNSSNNKNGYFIACRDARHIFPLLEILVSYSLTLCAIPPHSQCSNKFCLTFSVICFIFTRIFMSHIHFIRIDCISLQSASASNARCLHKFHKSRKCQGIPASNENVGDRHAAEAKPIKVIIAAHK